MKYVVENSGLSQTAVAEKLGISQPRLNQYLNGKREADYAFVAKFCRFFNITPNFLFEFDDNGTTENALDCFTHIVHKAEMWAIDHDVTFMPDDKAELIRFIYKKVHNLPQSQQDIDIDNFMELYVSVKRSS